jgi:hypothetical protein
MGKIIIFSGIFYDAFSVADYITSNGRMLDELERIWKKVVLA